MGEKILVTKDTWIPGAVDYKLSSSINSVNISMVMDLIDNKYRKWKKEVIVNTFSEAYATKILHIPLMNKRHEDMLVWRGGPSGEFLVRSTYKLLQEGTSDPNDSDLQNAIRDFLQKIVEFKTPY